MQKEKIKIKQSNALKGFLFRAAQPSRMTIKKYVILNLIQDLRRLSCLLRNSIRGRFQIKFGMTPLFNKEAFTLIELLVVVLIIGILAAIALPQYQKAVEKSRSAEGITMLKTIYDAQNLYYLAHGEYATRFDQLDISIPWNGTEKGSTEAKVKDTLSNKDWSLQIYTPSTGFVIMITRLTGRYAGTGFMFRLNGLYPNSLHKLLCIERRNESGINYDDPTKGSYCINIHGASWILGNNQTVSYKMK